MSAFSEIELFQPVNLCDEQGRLNPAAVGWSRQPLHTCNVHGSWPRKKKWNYWCVTTPDFLFSVTLSNIDYMGLAFAYFLDFKSQRFIEQTVMTPFAGGFDMPETVGADVHFKHRQMAASFLNKPGEVLITTESPVFGGARLAANLQVSLPPHHETLNVVIPWSQQRFQFTSKQNSLPASGEITLGSETFPISDGFACLDFGRGIWPYQCFWNWASFATKTGEHTVGANLGAGWTDNTGLTENGLCLDGCLDKLDEDVTFEYDSSAFMKPWRLRSKSSRQVDLVFEPFFERVAKTDLAILRSEVHQMIGHFSGVITTKEGANLAVDHAVGWAEDHHARW